MPAPLPPLATLAYGLPALALGLVLFPLHLAVPRFFEERVGIQPWTIFTIVIGVRCFDVLVAPAIGYASDVIPTRFGRRRPWLAMLPLPLMAAVVMAFDPVPGAGVVWFCIAMLLAVVLSTATAVVHEAQGLDQSGSHDQRTTRFAIRDGCLLSGALLSSLSWNPLEPMPEDWLALGLVLILPLLAVTMTLCVVFTPLGRTIPEHDIRQGPAPALDPLQDLRSVLSTRPFLILCAIHSFIVASIAGLVSLSPWYLDHTVRLNGRWALPIALFGGLCGLALSSLWARRKEKVAALRGCLLIFGAGEFGLWALPQGNQSGLWCLAACVGLGAGGAIGLCSSLLADCPDLLRHRNGRGLEGLHAGLWMQTRKLPAIGAASLGFWSLQRLGVMNQEHLDFALRAHVREICCLGPAALCAIALLLVGTVRVDRRLMHSLAARIGD